MTQEVSPAHMLRPVTPDEAVFEVRVALAQVVEQARFLGLDPETVSILLTEESAPRERRRKAHDATYHRRAATGSRPAVVCGN
jgi:hypothetical protein